MRWKIKVSDRTTTVTLTPRPNSVPDSVLELHFLASPLRNCKHEWERDARLVQAEGMRSENRQQRQYQEQIRTGQAAWQAKERLIKDTLPPHSLPLKWTANQRILPFWQPF